MKKTIITAIIAFIIVLVSLWLIMELRFHGTVIAEANMTEEKVLREMPSIVISEKDLEMEKYILSLPEVQTMLKEPSAELSQKKTEILLTEYIPDGYEASGLALLNDNIYLTLNRGEKETISYVFSASGNFTAQKTIALYKNGLSGRTCTACYTNDTMGIRKLIFRHQWFGWLKQP